MKVRVLMLAFSVDGTERMVTIPDGDHDDETLLGLVFQFGQNEFAIGPEKNTTPSVSMGDVVALDDGRFFLCQMIGWKELTEDELEAYRELDGNGRCGVVLGAREPKKTP